MTWKAGPLRTLRSRSLRVFYGEGGDLTPWLTRAREQGAQRPDDGLSQLPLTLAATRTGPDGQFQLTGIGRERIAQLSISGPTIATTEVYAMNRDGAEVRVRKWTGMPDIAFVIHPRRFEYSVAPTKPIEGIIRDKDTGRPIAGLTLRAGVYDPRKLGTDPGHRGDDRRPGPLSPHRPAQGAGLSTGRRSG